MSKRSLFCLLGFLLALPVIANAQQAMEMYIPIGASVGVSNTSSVIGKIVSVDEQSKTFIVKDSSGESTINLPDNTPIWLDRSKEAGVNQVGSAASLRPGLTVEVKFKEATRAPLLTADWIKVEMPR